MTNDQQIISLFRSHEFKTNSFNLLKASLIIQLLNDKKFLGKGATSVVYRVKNCYNKKGYLCLKILNDENINRIIEDNLKKEKSKKSIWTEEEDEEEEEHLSEEDKYQIDVEKVKQLYCEYEIIHRLNHPNIIKVYGFFNGDETHSPAILLEYCDYNLENVIKEFKNFELVGVIYEICSAMKYVHMNKIIHRDLKMKNILINKNRHVKICDFGIAKVVDLTTYTSTKEGCGTLPFMAPELFDPNIKSTEKVDVYSFGVVMHFIVTQGQMPQFRIHESYEKLELPETINALSQSIIKRCWSTDPNNRPSFDEIINLIVQNNFSLIDGIEDKIPKLKNFLGLK